MKKRGKKQVSEHRIVRLQEQIREEIAKMIYTHKIKDSRVDSFLCINRVVISSTSLNLRRILAFKI